MSLLPKPLPTDLSFDALFGPNTEYDYFRDADSQPFMADAAEFESVNAWWLAEAALLVYVSDHDFARQRLAAAGLTDCRFFEDEKTGTQAFVCHNDEFAIACFRGTEKKLEDILTDARIKLVEHDGAGRVHQGFSMALDSVWPEMQTHLDALHTTRQIWFAGHSLGAALATLASARYPHTQGAYVMAAPRCGDEVFCESQIANYWHFSNNNDLVPKVPPETLGYAHAGHPVCIDDSGELIFEPTFWQEKLSALRGYLHHDSEIINKWAGGDFSAVPADSIADHAPIYYVVHIWNYHIQPFDDYLE